MWGGHSCPPNAGSVAGQAGSSGALSHSGKNQNQSGGQECPPHIYFASVTCSRDSLYVPNLFATGFSVG
jgi:hypothetical protein